MQDQRDVEQTWHYNWAQNVSLNLGGLVNVDMTYFHRNNNNILMLTSYMRFRRIAKLLTISTHCPKEKLLRFLLWWLWQWIDISSSFLQVPHLDWITSSQSEQYLNAIISSPQALHSIICISSLLLLRDK
jgi:hypothetical protein